MVAAYQYNTDTGTINVDSEDMLDDVQKEWTDVFGSDMDLDSSTPQGTMIGSEATNRIGVMKNNADMANLLNPNLSYGPFLDSICSFLIPNARGVETSTVGTGVEFDGDPGTIIQAGFRMKNSAGDIFQVVEQVVIGSTRAVLGNIKSQSAGSIPLPVGDLEIVDAVIGWGAAKVLSSTAVTLGTNALSDSKLKTRRNQRLWAQGLSATGAIKSHLLGVNNVTSVKIEENLTGAAGVVNGVTFTKPGIWICVAGTATNQDIADAIHAARQAAVIYDYGTNSGTPVDSPNGTPVLDPYSDSVYSVKFTRAVDKVVYVRMTIKKGSSTASQVAIARVMKQYADGELEGEEGFVVGQSISAFELAGAVCRAYPGLYVSAASVAVTAVGAAAPVDEDYKGEQPLKPWEQGTLAIGNITVSLS